MSVLSLNGVKIAYQFFPSADPRAPIALLLHGLGSRSQDWILQVQALSLAGYDVWTPEPRGLGDSSKLRGWPTVEDLAADMISLLVEEVGRPAHVAGLSLGGTVALAMAIKKPELVRSLTLVNTFAHLPLWAVNRRNAFGRSWNLIVGSMERLGEWVANDLFPSPKQVTLRSAAAERIAENRRGAYLKLLIAVYRFDVRRKLGDIKVPTLVVAGARDSLVPLKLKEDLAEGIPGAQLALIAGSGHATPIDAAEEFNAQLINFLSQAESGRVLQVDQARRSVGC